MSTVSIIAALDEQSGLGFNNQLLCHLPADLQHFKMLTMGKPIIMGYKTFESIGKPLPGRRNIVLSRRDLKIEGAEVVNSLEKALRLSQESSEIMIIGGEQLFIQAMPLVSRLYITRIHHHFMADVFFPQINEKVWGCIEKKIYPQDEKNAYDMTFYTYMKKQ
jgi:dihydrofolate reductase